MSAAESLDLGRYRPGETAQHESDVAHRAQRESLERQGVLFFDMDTARRECPELVRDHYGTLIPADDSVWSGGSFVYVPPGVRVEVPLQAIHRVDAAIRERFERTLIVADEGSRLHYLEGCSAPTYTAEPQHASVVEIVVKPAAHVTHTTIQNWSANVVNRVVKRARVDAEGRMEWIDGNIGSKSTTACSTVVLAGPRASGDARSIAYAGHGQCQDVGATMIHAAPETTSSVVAKSISTGGGHTSFRSQVWVEERARGCASHAQCDALVLDEDSAAHTDPHIEDRSGDAVIGHEGTISDIGDEQLFYLRSRGLSDAQAKAMIVNGFVEPVTRTLPMEYAVEWSRLIELQMADSVG